MTSKQTYKHIKYVGSRPKNDQDNPCRAQLCHLVRNVGCFHEIYPEKLYIINLAKDEDSKEFCQEYADFRGCPFIFWDPHDTPTLNYESFNMDFGPYNLAATHQFCSKLKVWLDTIPYRNSDKHIVIVLDDKDTKKKLNITLLVSIAAMVLLNLTDEEVIQRLRFAMMHKGKPGEIKKELVCREKRKFKDVSGNPSVMNLCLEDCIRAFYAAIQHKFYDYYEFDPAEYLFYETVMSGDLNWIIPGKILAFAGPCDKMINSKLYHKHPPKFYHDYFRDHNVTTIIRLNEPEYDSAGFSDAGFEHHDLIFPDGYPPTSTIAARFIKMVDEAKGASAVHCYAGIGRTGTLIAAYLMARYDFTAQMAVAWTRICRPGSVIGGQQDWLYTKFNPLSMLKNNLNSFRPIKSRKTKTNSPAGPVKEDTSQDEPNPKTSYAVAERTLGQAKALLLAKKQRDICDRPCTRNLTLLKNIVAADSSLTSQEQKTTVLLDLGRTIPLTLSLADLKDLGGESPEFYRLKDNLYEWKVKFPKPGYVELKHDLKKDLQAASLLGIQLDQVVREPVLDFVFRHEPPLEAPESSDETNLVSDTTISKLKPVVYYNLVVCYTMFGGVSTLRRLKARFRRITMTNMIVIVLILTIVLFISSMFSHNNFEYDKTPDKSRAINIPRLSFRGFADKLTNNNSNNDVSNDNQIDDPEHARASSAATFRDGVLGNYETLVDTNLSRPGDNGSKFDIDTIQGIDQQRVEELKREYGVNMIASDYIPMDRIVPDIRHPECKYWHYPETLPTTSVVIVFHNEGLTTLMRTVHSVLLRSARKLIKEVVLLDDCSDKANLKGDLEDYIKRFFGDFKGGDIPTYSPDKSNQGETLYEKSGKVKLIRNKQRQGLIRSRSRGATESTGEVIVFLDAHCEVNQDWLPPLLAPIANNRKTLTVPIIDGIDSSNFEYRPVYSKNDEHFRGIWEWGMLYKEIGLNMKEHLKTHRVSEPYDSPTHAGGLFAIDRQFFADLQYYDPGLLIWGGENFELSFKVWQCGGRLQWVPCSRVGHIYRPFMPYSFGSMANQRKGPLVLTNYKRVVEVWFDDAYKEYFYTREPLARFYDPGDITKQLELKKNLGCKSFDWFMTNVASDVFRDFPKLPMNLEWGEVQLKGTNKCLDTRGPQPPQNIILSTCHSLGGNQLFRLNAAGQLGVGERCVDASKSKMSLIYCKLGHVEGPWKLQGHHMIHKSRNLCLTYDERVHLATCDFESSSSNQQWVWKKIRPNVYDE